MSAIQWTKVIEDLRNEDDVELMLEAGDLIAAEADEDDLPRLYSLLEDEDFFVRETVAEPLARLGGIKALPVLFHAMTRGTADGHDNDSLSFIIVELLEQEKKAVAPILLEMIESPKSKTRESAAWAFGFVAPEIPSSPLIRALRDEDAGVRAAAVGSLPSFKDDVHVFEALIIALSDDDEQVRISSISALGYLGDKHAIPNLQKFKKGFFSRTKHLAEEALQQLGAS